MNSWQVAAAAVTDRDWDVAIVGCGPSGAIAAMQLAREGLRVAAIERHAFPRDKVCGDALIPDAIRVLDRFGLLDRVRAESHEARRLLLYSPAGIEVPVATRALVIRREQLDAMLAEGAANAGAVIAQGQVLSIDGQRVAIRDAGELRARVILIATGADVRLLNALGMVERPLATGVAVRCYVRAEERIDDLVISFERHIPRGYAWIFPLADGAYNVGCGVNEIGGRVNLKKALDVFLETKMHVTSRSPVAGATLRAGLRGAAAVKGNVLAIGETIGATLPLSGEGIGKAMETGERAASVVSRALRSDDLAQLGAFSQELRPFRPIYHGYGVAQSWMSRAWLNDFMAARMRRSPEALQKLSGILDETVDPRALFSLRGVWNMLAR